jgi:hypothetical protein
LRIGRRDIRREATHHIALAIDEELLEIPRDVSFVLRSEPVLVERLA